jgi:nicotinamide phosphoribosyltransferase
MKKPLSIFMVDFYKTIHHQCYKKGMTQLVSYWTPRMSRNARLTKVVCFGIQSFAKKYLIDHFNENFFELPIEMVIAEYKRVICPTMGEDIGNDITHIRALHKLGYLPLKIKALAEGKRSPIKVPMFEISCTNDQFAWLVNYIETIMSCNVWQPMTSATIAYEYRRIIDKYYDMTCSDNKPRNRACGDFSMRGFGAPESSESSGAGHLLSFLATASVPSILYLENYYNCELGVDEIGYGTPSTEHSVMSSYGRAGEFECYETLLSKFPKGVLSIVSDTYDYWNVLTNFLPKLKDKIMSRDGKIVIRGDSGDPVDILCGIPIANKDTPEYKGTVEILWDIFGGTINSKGYKELDPHIGAVYGDAITMDRCEDTCQLLEAKGFAASNVVFGIGSFTYQYNTRDTLGFALKATDAIIAGVETPIFKDPITDKDKFKKSQKGACIVYEVSGELVVRDCLTIEETESSCVNLLETVFENSTMVKEQSLMQIRRKLHGGKF